MNIYMICWYIIAQQERRSNSCIMNIYMICWYIIAQQERRIMLYYEYLYDMLINNRSTRTKKLYVCCMLIYMNIYIWYVDK